MIFELALLVTMLFKGLIIGILASAPMGPVGVLCIQRTLNKGRWYGFVTGLGAAASDLLYALVTGFGMRFVMNVFKNQQFLLEIIGSMLLFLFGLYSYKSKPPKFHQPGPTKGTLTHNGITAFLLTVSNPLIIALFVALFARFTFIIPDKPIHQVAGYVAIVSGALAWWYFITYAIDKVRKRFNERGLGLINRLIGGIVMVVALCGLCITVIAPW